VRRRLAVVSWLVLLVSLPSPAVAAGVAEYRMATVVHYTVDPVAGAIGVAVAVDFTNILPNPLGAVSGFDRIDLALHDGASQVAAADAKGSLAVSIGSRDGVAVASVTPRSRVRYQQSVAFTLSYRLKDGSAPDVHVRADVAKFEVYGFGTSSHVTVDLPPSYQARADGSPMVANAEGGVVRLTSGAIGEPDSWLALVTASRPTPYRTHAASVALASGTVDLQVRAWTSDAGWGERTLAMLVAALPRLEEAIGLPYPRVGPLVVTETVGAEGSAQEPLSSGAEVQVGFDELPFMLLHQAAHLWINEGLASDRWIREGLASHYAARVAVQLGEPVPYDPTVRASELASTGQPLSAWGTGDPGMAGDAYPYAASWAFVERITRAVGEAHLSEALRRVVAGMSAYDPAPPDPPAAAAHGFTPVDSRRMLDQLAAVSSADLVGQFGEAVLDPVAAGELASRTAARADYRKLSEAAGDWGIPDPIRAAMAAWRFDVARPAIAAAEAWLAARDTLLSRIARAGLTTPSELRARFAADGGGADARTELDAERAVVDSYIAQQKRAVAQGGPLDKVGMFAADDPSQLLAAAKSSFGRGDLRAAAEVLDRLALQLDRAPTNGVVRIASGVVLLLVIGLIVGRTVRRRGGSHYTAAP
jgi:hypothetical protein